MEQEYRLWDSQWANIVNHESCYQDCTKEEAVALAAAPQPGEPDTAAQEDGRNG